MAAAYPLQLRERACDLMLAGWTCQRIATELGVAPRTVRRWLQRWRQTGRLAIGTSPGRRRVIGVDEERRLAAQLRAYPMAPLASHCRLWEAATGVRVSSATMCRAIQRLGWTRQRRLARRQPQRSPFSDTL